jgi:hypothetical protein
VAPPDPAPPTTARGGRLWRAARWLAADDPVTGVAMALLFLYYTFSWGPWQGKAAGDGWFGFLYLRALIVHHTLDMRTVAPDFLPFFGLLGPGQHMPNRCPIGPVFLWLPFYLVALLVDAIGQLGHFAWARPHHPPRLQIVISGYGTLLIVLLGWRALFRLIERHLDRSAARLGGLVAVFATPILFYTVHHSFYQHGPAFGVVCLFVESWDRTRDRSDLRRFATLGALAGFAAMMRLQESLFLLLPGCEVLAHLLRGPQRQRWLLGGLTCLLTTLLAFSPQLAAWHYYTGHALSPPQIEPLRFAQPFVATALFSTRAGLFPWTPVAYLAVAGIIWTLLARDTAGRLRSLVGGLLLVFVGDLYIVSCAWLLHSGYTFGSRRLSDGALLIGLATAALFARLRGRRGRQLLLGFVAFCAVYNATLCELLRLRKIRSSGAEARSLASALEYELHAPGWLVRVAEQVGYPFAQPAGWIFAAWHHLPPAAYESVVGNFLLDRDGQWMSILNHSLTIDRAHRWYFASGLVWPSERTAEVRGPVRMLLPLFAKESVAVTARGHLAPGPLQVRCNGGPPVAAQPLPKGFAFQLAAACLDSGINELELDLPIGTTLEELQFAPIAPPPHR